MSTTPLPPFPRPSVFDPGRFGVAYSQGQMVDFATQARADLEAENARLREALKTVQAAIYMDDAGQLRLTKSFDESVIDVALESKP